MGSLPLLLPWAPVSPCNHPCVWVMFRLILNTFFTTSLLCQRQYPCVTPYILCMTPLSPLFLVLICLSSLSPFVAYSFVWFKGSLAVSSLRSVRGCYGSIFFGKILPAKIWQPEAFVFFKLACTYVRSWACILGLQNASKTTCSLLTAALLKMAEGCISPPSR